MGSTTTQTTCVRNKWMTPTFAQALAKYSDDGKSRESASDIARRLSRLVGYRQVSPHLHYPLDDLQVTLTRR